MGNFKLKQKIVCVKHFKGVIYRTTQKVNAKLPKVGNIYIIKSITQDGFLGLEGFPYTDCFDPTKFEPLRYISATSEILEKFPLTEEKSDVEIRELETMGCSPISEGRATNE